MGWRFVKIMVVSFGRGVGQIRAVYQLFVLEI